MEAADAGITFAVCITDGLPTQDMVQVKSFLRRFPVEKRMRFVGPTTAYALMQAVGMVDDHLPGCTARRR